MRTKIRPINTKVFAIWNKEIYVDLILIVFPNSEHFCVNWLHFCLQLGRSQNRKSRHGHRAIAIKDLIISRVSDQWKLGGKIRLRIRIPGYR